LAAFTEDGKRCLITDADCDSWRCPECSEKLRQHWTLRAAHGAKQLLDEGIPLSFATITSNPKLTDFDSCARMFPNAWLKLHKRLNRTSDVREYILIPEHHRDGRLHMHAIWSFGVNTRWLKDNCASCGFGYMSQIGRRGKTDEKITHAHQVSEYVSKELGKQLGYPMPARFRRVRTSAHWAELDSPESEAGMMNWQYIGSNGALQTLYERCANQNLTMIDVRTGEIFEDVDLGTLVAY